MALLVSSCDAVVYHKFETVGDGWRRNDTLMYRIATSPHLSGACDAEVELRCTSEYPYKDLWLYVELSTDSSVIECDTLQCFIYDDNGVINGSTAGLLYQMSFSIPVSPVVSEDTLNMRVVHVMADEPLYGVKDVGIKLLRSGRSLSSGN